MPRKYVEVEVELNIEEFDNEELIDELKDRSLSTEELGELRAICNVKDNEFNGYQIESLADLQKFELFIEYIDDFTIEQFEIFINKLNKQ